METWGAAGRERLLSFTDLCQLTPRVGSQHLFRLLQLATRPAPPQPTISGDGAAVPPPASLSLLRRLQHIGESRPFVDADTACPASGALRTGTLLVARKRVSEFAMQALRPARSHLVRSPEREYVT